MQSANEEVYRLLNKINEEGSESAPRGLKVRELHMHTLKLSPNFPLMDFEDRPFNFKYFMGEMAWYLLKDSNISYINNFSSFWNRIADHAGNVNSNYGKLLFGDQLQWVLDTLKADINSRQAIAFVNQPKFQYEGNKDFVCTMYLNFWIRDNKLNLKVQMRSNDIFYGTTYDVAFFAMVQQTMWIWLRDKYTELELGTYYHCADNLHFYERHFNLAEQIMNETIKTPYLFLLKAPLFEINNKQYSLTDAGKKMISEVDGMLESGTTITQEIAFQTLHNYFHIQ
jgi:thymidylate synthase